MNSNVIAFDFGMKHIGTAIGQRAIRIAHPLISLNAHVGEPNWDKVTQLLATWKPAVLVVGLPLNMDGSEQKLTKHTYLFVGKLKRRFSIPVALHDERLSTVEARSRLFEFAGYRKMTKNRIDNLSAAIILQEWLNYCA